MAQAKQGRRSPRSYGKVRKLPSGRYQAQHLGPDGRYYTAPNTFQAVADADAWVAKQHADISREVWHKPEPPRKRQPRFDAYAEAWIAGRKLTPRTRSEYGKTYRTHLKNVFGPLDLDEITPPMVREWHSKLGQATGPTATANAYGLLRTILKTAVADDAIPSNPCRVAGAGSKKRAKPIHPATLAELAVIVEHMRPAYRAAVLIAAWCALRFGEVAELRRKDVLLDADQKGGTLRIRRGVTYVQGEGHIIGTPKADSIRDVAIPPHLVPVIASHLRDHAEVGAEGLLFPAPRGGHLRDDGAMHDDFEAARLAAGRPDLTFHGLRHTGAVLAAATGATLAELMARLGHTTQHAAIRYQHAASDRDKTIADALSELHLAQIVKLQPATANAE